MLPAVIVTLATFLLELCSSSPVYNMQPAFVTNTVGATTGRNIRNLPCISRKNNNLHGVCMFAIDCVKSNGTHLGTCIDRFYFGSCCLIESVHDIIDNTIESDIIPHREPPLRITNTTSTTISSTKPEDISSSIYSTMSTASATSSVLTTTERISASTMKLELFEQKTKAPMAGEYKAPANLTTTTSKPVNAASTEKLSSTTEATTTPQKLQTFQVVDGNIIQDVPTTTHKLSTTTLTPTAKPIQTKPSTKKPVPTRPTIKQTPRPTLKPKPVRNSTTTVKTTKPTRPITTRATQKPTKTSTKPIRTTTKKPVVQTTKAPIRNPTNPTATPTKKVPTATTTATIIKNATVSITKPTISSSTHKPVSTSAVPSSTEKTEDVTVKNQPVRTSTVSNEIPVNKINVSQILETVNGNPATNEIEAASPIIPLVTTKPGMKPGLVTWTVVDEKNHTESSTTGTTNLTTEDWVPITTPDGWVLLPSVEPNSTNIKTTTPTSSTNVTISSTTISSSSSPTTAAITLTTESHPTTTATAKPSSITTEGKPSITYIPFESTTLPLVTVSFQSTTAEPVINATSTPELAAESTTSALDQRPVNMSDFTDVCGRRMYPEARIVGGEKSSYGKWPWQISLRQWRTSTYLHKCGAALLNENWAITAAHCVDQVPPSELLLRLGEHDLSTESEPYLHQERRVQIVASHPQFDPRTFEYDLALLRFYEPVTFQPNILPVCVPQNDENFVGRTAYVTGWGRLYENGPLPSVLQEVSVPVINNTVCEAMYRSAGYIEHIPHIFICAGWRRGGFDSCEGDSGGPMVIQREDKRFLLAGVISWGIGCAEPNQPGVYTRISEFRDWINQILQF